MADSSAINNVIHVRSDAPGEINKPSDCASRAEERERVINRDIFPTRLELNEEKSTG